MRVKSFCGCFSLKSGALFLGWCTVICSILGAIPLGFQFNHLYSSRHDSIMRIILMGMMVSMIVVGSTGGLMVYGVLKKHHGYIFPWIARTAADFMILCAFSIAFLLFGAVGFPLAAYFMVLAVLLTILAFHGYIWLVIYSYYIHLIAEKYGCAGSCTEVKKFPTQPLNIYHHI